MKKTSITRLNERYGMDVWLDDFSLEMLRDGTLDNLMDSGLSGMTTNPSIFQKAITSDEEFKRRIQALHSIGINSKAVLLQIMSKVVRDLADKFETCYEKSNYESGYVSIELDPTISHDAVKMENEAKFLWESVDRENVLIKIPATDEGVIAVENVIASGINVNVTLLFSPTQYEKIISAYKNGVDHCKKNKSGRTPFSVASVFISRIDALAENEGLVEEKERGKLAIANTARLYKQYIESFNSEQWRATGLREQKLLLASTGVKNKSYSTLKYVESLLYDNVINTMPLTVIQSLMEKGELDTTQTSFEQMLTHFNELARKVDMQRLYRTLIERGEKIFVDAWNSTISLIDTL
jgi:transaldolase